MKTWRVTPSPSHACLCREARGEALTGGCIGQPLSRDSPLDTRRKTDEARELAMRQIINSAAVSEAVVDIFDAVGLDKPNIGILDDAFLAEVQNLPERNLAVELPERILRNYK